MAGFEGAGVVALLKLLAAVAQSRGILDTLFLANKIRNNRQIDVLSDADLIRRLNPGKDVEVRIEGGVVSMIPIERNYDSFDILQIKDHDILNKEGNLRLWEAFMHERKNEQLNVDAVLDHAVDEVINRSDSGSDVSSVPADQTWISRFFSTSKHVSNPEMQHFWGKLLAAEVMSPGSYSPRTIATLEGMTPDIAHLFEKFARYVIEDQYVLDHKTISTFYFIPSEKWKVHDITYKDILELSHYDLVYLDSSSYTVKNEDEQHGIIKIGEYHLLVGVADDKPVPKLNVRFLTKAGSEILKLTNPDFDYDYISKIATKINQMNSEVRIVSDMVPTAEGVGWRKVHWSSQPG